jgi:hypothetical protein
VISRMCLLLTITLCPVTFLSANACTLNEIDRGNMLVNFCGGVAMHGCTGVLLKSQVEDQFKEIALARRCGYKAEADKLDNFYKLTTPLVIELYECVDQPIDRAQIEQTAKQDTDKNLAAMPQGCSSDLKAQLANRLHGEISEDEKSLAHIKEIASRIDLAK